jgi:hypothetical protein
MTDVSLICAEHGIDEFFCRQLHDPEYLEWWSSLDPIERVKRELHAVTSSFIDEPCTATTEAALHGTITAILQQQGVDTDTVEVVVVGDTDGRTIRAIVNYRQPPPEWIDIDVVETNE